MASITNKEIIEKLDCLEARYSNGQLDEIHETVKEILSSETIPLPPALHNTLASQSLKVIIQ